MAEYAVVLVVGFLVVLCAVAALMARPGIGTGAGARRAHGDRSFPAVHPSP